MLDKYFNFLRGTGKSEKTIGQYNFHLDRFFSWSKLDPLEVTSDKLTEYRQHMIESGSRPKTIDNFIGIIKAFYSWMQREGYINEVPTGTLKRMTRDEISTRWLEKGERSRLLRTLSKETDLRSVAIIYILLYAGLMPNELLALTHDDILIEDGTGHITVRTGTRPRMIPIDSDTQEVLGHYIAEENPVGDYLFPSRTDENTQLTYASLLKIVQNIGKKAKIKQLNPKVLRHTFCHDLIERGVRMEVVSLITGISEMRNLLMYKKVDYKDLERAMKK